MIINLPTTIDHKLRKRFFALLGEHGIKWRFRFNNNQKIELENCFPVEDGVGYDEMRQAWSTGYSWHFSFVPSDYLTEMEQKLLTNEDYPSNPYGAIFSNNMVIAVHDASEQY